jgi:hypothetical protein
MPVDEWAARRPGLTVAWPSDDLLGVAGVASGAGGGVGRPFLRPSDVEGSRISSAEALLELEQDPDAGEVHAPLPGQVADPGDPSDVVLAVQADVRRRPRRTEQTLILVDPKVRGCALTSVAATLMT